jgi:phosphohistidine phosphatase
MYELLVMRHGKSGWPAGVSDEQRPLKARGEKNASRMGHWLVEQGLLPDQVISSPARRAMETAQRVCDAMAFPASRIVQQPRIYEASLDDLLQLLHELPGSLHRVLLIGHNPGLEHLLIHLCPVIPVPDDGKLLPTASLAHLQSDHDWSALGQDGARLLSLTRPRFLSD